MRENPPAQGPARAQLMLLSRVLIIHLSHPLTRGRALTQPRRYAALGEGIAGTDRMKEPMDARKWGAVGGDSCAGPSWGKASGLWAESQHSWEQISLPLSGHDLPSHPTATERSHQGCRSGGAPVGCPALTPTAYQRCQSPHFRGSEGRICVRTPQPGFLAE